MHEKTNFKNVLEVEKPYKNQKQVTKSYWTLELDLIKIKK